MKVTHSGSFRRTSPNIKAYGLKDLSPVEPAKVACSISRQTKLDSIAPLIATIAAELMIKEDPLAKRKQNSMWVQAAELALRMASGSFKRWERELIDGKVYVGELHQYFCSYVRLLIPNG